MWREKWFVLRESTHKGWNIKTTSETNKKRKQQASVELNVFGPEMTLTWRNTKDIPRQLGNGEKTARQPGGLGNKNHQKTTQERKRNIHRHS